MPKLADIVDRLRAEGSLPREEYRRLLEGFDGSTLDYIGGVARQVKQGVFGNGVYLRGLVEVSNRCACGCYYCGLRAENRNVERYSMTADDILTSCAEGYEAGLRTFVLQGGQVAGREEFVADVVRQIKAQFEGVAVTLSLGEQPSEVYELWRKAGADRYLLRHESAVREHYEHIHPKGMSFEGRHRCLAELRRLGYQIGAGFMVGVPGQTTEVLVEEMKLLEELRPEMVGIGPFIPQAATPFGDRPRGSVALTLLLLSMVRLVLPEALLPATTALATAEGSGTIRGVLAGANVVMPNITPLCYRDKYAIYDGKKSSGTECVAGIERLDQELAEIGSRVDLSRGDHPQFARK
ncbi:MAG: [Tidjanibacter sp.]|nr:[FeFe] hydrogenase H-cluster radical SAM maturase HydE [Tidjanibacter sp.]MBQ5931607.1 [FeFe] hydrogenase H-cluster radical SAM maturase HydE [Tidjanibacter sp.]